MSIPSNPHNQQVADDGFDTVRVQTGILHFIEAILEQPDPFERAMLLNELREYLNQACVLGYFGSPRAHACQRIVGMVHQIDKIDENNKTNTDDLTANDDHDMKKRFFCNGFIGCKNAGR